MSTADIKSTTEHPILSPKQEFARVFESYTLPGNVPAPSITPCGQARLTKPLSLGLKSRKLNSSRRLSSSSASSTVSDLNSTGSSHSPLRTVTASIVQPHPQSTLQSGMSTLPITKIQHSTFRKPPSQNGGFKGQKQKRSYSTAKQWSILIKSTLEDIALKLAIISYYLIMFVLTGLTAPARKSAQILDFVSRIHQEGSRSSSHSPGRSCRCRCKGSNEHLDAGESKRKALLELKEQQQKKEDLRQIMNFDSKLLEKRLAVVLDLDHTLIHSLQGEPLPEDKDYFEIKDKIFVYRRPYLESFLKELHEVATIHLFTASDKSYADQIIQVIDPFGYFQKKFYREDCKKDSKNQIYKDLSIVAEDMRTLVMIDDNQLTYEMNKLNTFKIPEWKKTCRDDTELRKCIDVIHQLNAFEVNVPKDLPDILDLHQIWQPQQERMPQQSDAFSSD